MARKKTETVLAEKPVVDGEALIQAFDAQVQADQAAQENALALAVQLGYDGALSVSGLEDEIKFFQRRSVEAVLETGKRLLLLKEITGHGGFMERLSALGIGQALANKLMSATLKFSNSSSTTNLTSLPGMNQTKLLELLVLDESEIEALDQGETVRGMKLDDVDCMSVSELRRALRVAKVEHEAALAAKDAVVTAKNKKIDELVSIQGDKARQTNMERQLSLEEDLNRDVLHTVSSVLAVRNRIHDICSTDDLPRSMWAAMSGALNRVITEVTTVASDYGIALELGLDYALSELPDPNEGEEVGSDDFDKQAGV